MHIRMATELDAQPLLRLLRTVASGGGLPRLPDEIAFTDVETALRKSLHNGFCLVMDHPEGVDERVACVLCHRAQADQNKHILCDLLLAVHPAFQHQKRGRTLMTILLEEIALHHPTVGKVELMVREDNAPALALYASLGFQIEGRLEMRARTAEATYLAEIVMSWQNPNFEF
ncbi:MAG: GNAT family N-acetyltransferase [Cyclobacteriaceae bacterium]|jgi:ribosomal protein S18 acetylase RimI-like enzyme|nr:GNAT family N-acetyltransferase [Cyclobacteriaceae bacterium]